jgi:hypothetical protein
MARQVGLYPLNELVVIAPMFLSDPDIPQGMVGVVYRIAAFLRTNVELEPVSGGQRIRITPIVLTRAPLPGETQEPIIRATAVKGKHNFRFCGTDCRDQYEAQGGGWIDPTGREYNRIGCCANCVKMIEV